MTVIVAAMGWSWQEAGVDPLTGAVSADPHDRGPARADFAALEHALRLARDVGCPGGSGDRRPGRRRHDAAGCAGRRGGRGAPGRASRPELRRCGQPTWSAAGRTCPPRSPPPCGSATECPTWCCAATARRTGAPARSPPSWPRRSMRRRPWGSCGWNRTGDRVLRVHRRLDGGRREVLRVRGPAVVSVEAAGVRLRRAALPATLASRDAAIPVTRMAGAAAHRVARPGRPPVPA